MTLPSRIQLSKKASDRFRAIKANTGVTPNILSRIAISISLSKETGISNSGVEDNNGQELSREVLFGDLAATYELLIKKFMLDNQIEGDIREVTVGLIEMGVHKLGHVRSVDDLIRLTILGRGCAE
ncbi:MAG: DndE family protein [Gammaproteobacteria bacterium]|nr:DndE family protein [Gammaproteobacteria bacterium]